MTMWKKTKLMLGLAADEEYDDYDDYDHVETREQVPARAEGALRAERPEGNHGPQPMVVRTASGGSSSDSGALAPASAQRAQPARPPQRSVVRPIPAATTVKPHVMTPGSFNDAQDIGDKFKGKQPVIMNLEAADRDLARRLIDFASGLAYGLGGRMEKVADQVYMLVPTDVEVSSEERQRLRDRGLHDE